MNIAITGTIGSGKTMVSEYLRSKDIYVFDCDKYNSYLLENNKEVFDKVFEQFPECIDHLKINKSKLANIIFNSKEKREILENIIHPLIYTKMLDESKKHDLFFAEVPLLFEKNLQHYFDLTILVVCDSITSHNRLLAKGYTNDEIESREFSQLKVEEKLKLADEIIYNNGSYKDLFNEIDKLLIKYDWE